MSKKSRANKPKACYLCGKNGRADRLEMHHVFGGRYRKKSEKYGAVVYLCGEECHRNGRNAVHRNRAVNMALKEEFQRRIMAEHRWTVEKFIEEFGKNYT